MVQEPSSAPAAAATAREAQLPDIGLEAGVLDSPAEDAAASAPAAQPPAAAQQQQLQQQQAEGEVKVSLMGRGIWHAKGKVSFPTDPQVPPAASNLAPSGFCDPNLGLEPTDDGRCVCAQGERARGRGQQHVRQWLFLHCGDSRQQQQWATSAALHLKESRCRDSGTARWVPATESLAPLLLPMMLVRLLLLQAMAAMLT